MLTIKVINTPSKGTIKILCRRISDEIVKEKLKNGAYTSLGLIQGPLATMITAGDIAEKTSNVEIAEIIGNCPQHITVLGVFGDTASVSEALKAVEIWEKQAMLQP
jgi:ethanolamine utilization microcompartment shell protein EutS